jgi:3-hydroxyanthranilate 3,4-dioxygenase
MFLTYEEAVKSGPYDERPMLPSDIDLQIHLSRNDRAQPFFQICQHDSVLVVMSGAGRVEFKHTSVRHHTYETGDFIYVPAGTPHRIVPEVESIHYRYKLPESELEGVAWYCEGCGASLWREVWKIADELAQEGYLRACEEFNASPQHRTCESCGKVHSPIDLTPYRWREVAAVIREEAKTHPSR